MNEMDSFEGKTENTNESEMDEKRIEIKAILESNLCLGLAPNREYAGDGEA